MRLFGFEVTRAKALPPGTSYSTPSSRGGWWPIIREPFAGAWQRNIEATAENILGFSAVYACVTLIASDIAKLRVKLVKQDANGIWIETDSPSFSPVLRKPNHFQTRIKFFEQWLTSKLIHGNTYVLKTRDSRRVVTAMYVLDPTRVKPLVAPDGQVFYALQQDNLSRIDDSQVVVPASEIIHDVMVALYHPLCGVSPLSACGLAAMQGLRVQNHSSLFFANGANPGGVLTAPGVIDETTAKRLEERWNSEYGGDNSGKVAVLGDGLKYEPMSMSAVDSQLIEQLKWTAENVCTAFRVPAYMINVSQPPSYNNVEALWQQYYAQCLQTLIESIELLLDEGLGLDSAGYGTEFDLDALLRMDTAARVKAAADAIGSGAVAPNEARERWFDLGPTPGGDTPYLQQQNFSLAALAKRDAQVDPFATSTPAPTSTPEPTDEDAAKRFMVALRKELEIVRTA